MHLSGFLVSAAIDHLLVSATIGADRAEQCLLPFNFGARMGIHHVDSSAGSLPCHVACEKANGKVRLAGGHELTIWVFYHREPIGMHNTVSPTLGHEFHTE